MSKGLVGVVCSKLRNKVYCIEGSEFDNDHIFELFYAEIIYISSAYLSRLLSKYGEVSKWKLEDVLDLEVKQ